MLLPRILTRRPSPLAGVALLGAIGVIVLAGLSLHALEVTDARVRATGQAIEQDRTAIRELRQLAAAFEQALAAERGYLLTDDRSMLAGLRAAGQSLDQIMTGLAASPAWSASQRGAVAELTAGIRASIAEFDQTVALHDAGQSAAAIALVQHGAATVFDASLRARVGSMIDDMSERRMVDIDANHHEEAVALAVAIGGTGFGALVLLATCIVVAVQMRAHHKSEAALLAGRNTAQAANQAKSRFLAAVSHDLRQPLHAITLFIAALRRRTEGGELDTIIDNIAIATGAMQRMFTALLDVARLDAGAVVVQPRSFALDELLHALRAKFAPLAAARGLTLDIPDSGLFVWTDPALLESILSNLLANAVAYTAQGSVTMTARRHDRALDLEVRDTGPGIAAERLDRIFDEFVHLDHADPSGHGVGLGLAIVRLLADLLGARVTVESTPGAGSSFIVRLPFVPGDAAPPPPLPADPEPDLSGLRILVLDDDPLVLQATATEVADWGAQPLLVLSAAEAMAVMTDMAPQAPDGAIVDQDIIGEVSGVALLDRIAARFGVALPAVIVTGETSAGVRDELIDSGHPWLLKPADPATLRRTLAGVIAAAAHTTPPCRPSRALPWTRRGEALRTRLKPGQVHVGDEKVDPWVPSQQP